MFGISGTELVIILFFGFLIFGPDKLPQMGKTVGRAIRQFRTASEAANKKFKEQVADPFNDAIAPYKDQIEEHSKPLQEDINAINDTLNETKSMFTDPFKDMLKPTPKPAAAKPGVAIPMGTSEGAARTAGAATDDATAKKPSKAASIYAEADSASSGGNGSSEMFDSGDDPFEGILEMPESKPAKTGAGMQEGAVCADAIQDAAEQPDDGKQGAPIPTTSGKVKKSMAASLYDLDGSGE